jgi:hypothetical protein
MQPLFRFSFKTLSEGSPRRLRGEQSADFADDGISCNELGPNCRWRFGQVPWHFPGYRFIDGQDEDEPFSILDCSEAESERSQTLSGHGLSDDPNSSSKFQRHHVVRLIWTR